MSRVKVVSGFYNTQIFIDDLLHLSVKTEKLNGVTSYIKGENSYAIELYAGQKIICEYATRALWEEILKQLVDNKIA